MGLIAVIKNMFNAKYSNTPRLHGDIGNADPVCPYCDASLDRMPRRKKKCPSCGKFMYIRTRPNDKKKILISEDQISAIEEQWAIANGTHGKFLAERQAYEKERNVLRNKLGNEPSENDIQWSILNKELLKHAHDFKWGLYRNDKLQMGNILMKASKNLEALDVYLEVCYLDVNGPNNCGTLDPEILRHYPPFNPKMAMLAPGVIGYVEKLINNEHLTQEQLEQRFIKIAQRVGKSIKLPVDTESAWKTIKNEIYDGQRT